MKSILLGLLSALTIQAAGTTTITCQNEFYAKVDLLEGDTLQLNPLMGARRMSIIKVFNRGTLIGYLYLFPEHDGTYKLWKRLGADPAVIIKDHIPSKDTSSVINQVCAEDQTFFFPKNLRVRSAASAGSFGQSSSAGFGVDVDNDGIGDEISIEENAVRVILHTADDAVKRELRYPVGPIATSGVTADFNGDGKPDLAVVFRTFQPSGGVAILVGNGDGTFQAAANIPTGGPPSSIAVADFNGDGKPDLAVTLPGADSLSILLANGDGSFRAPQNIKTGSRPLSLVAADFNNDGITDIAVYNFSAVSVSVLLGVGDGSFRASLDSPAGDSRPTASPVMDGSDSPLAFADLNGDGYLDLLVLEGSNSALAVLLNQGNGAFQPPARYLGAQSPSLAVLPLEDGFTALFMVDGNTEDILLAFALPDGTLALPDLIAAGTEPSSIAAVDLDGDGNPDLVVSDAAGGTVQVIRAKGKLDFEGPVSYSLKGAGESVTSPQSIAFGDLNGDGWPDILVANQGSGSQQPGNVAVLLGAGDGSLRPVRAFAAGAGPVAAALADFNGDGKLDAVVAANGFAGANADPGGVYLLRGNGDGTFQPLERIDSPNGLRAYAIAAADVNGDGNSDLIVAYVSVDGALAAGVVSIYPGNGDGTFASPMNTTVGAPAGSPRTIVAGDLNGDGITDLVVLVREPNFNDVVAPLIGNGDGTFQAAPLAKTDFGAVKAAIADFDLDGKPDLAVMHCCGLTDATLLHGNGDGSLGAERHILSGPSPAAVAVADFNGDGKPDLAIAGRGESTGGSVLLFSPAIPPF